MHHKILFQFPHSIFPHVGAEMCECLSLLIYSWRSIWQQICASLTFHIAPAQHVQLLNAVSTRNLHSQNYQQLMETKGASSSLGEDSSGASVVGHGVAISVGSVEAGDTVRNVVRRMNGADMILRDAANSHQSSSSENIASLFTRRGQKGVNQDAMLLMKDFASCTGTIFCGVFDGHGPHGHLITRIVLDVLPKKLAACWKTLSGGMICADTTIKESAADGDAVEAWKKCLVQAYKLVDVELIRSTGVYCITSGTTAVTLVKQGYDVILGNVGDSRAILGSTAENGSLVATQLTVDLKPDLPGEAERIRQLNGRVFALVNEPDVQRVWLPKHNSPGLAMTRALGDYCLKVHGVIAEPEVTHWRLTNKDKFIVLATDGVWDVLSNEEVVNTVAATPSRSSAGKAVVDAAVHAWRSKHSDSKVDDCAVVCLFLDNSADSLVS